MRKLAAITVLASLGVACSADRDCRHKEAQCADGFVCDDVAGAWMCQPAGAGATESPAPVPTQAAPKTKKPTEPAPCPKHPQCVPGALECICDASGRLVSRSIDMDGDGEADEKAVLRYDSDGRLIETIVDEGIDGTDDKRHVYAYDGRGNPLAWEVAGLPGGNAAGYISRLVYRYDEAGNLLAEEFDMHLDKKVDKRCRYDPPCPPPIPNPACQRVCE